MGNLKDKLKLYAKRLYTNIKLAIKALLHGLKGVSDEVGSEVRKFQEKYGNGFMILEIVLYEFLKDVIKKGFRMNEDQADCLADSITDLITDYLMYNVYFSNVSNQAFKHEDIAYT